MLFLSTFSIYCNRGNFHDANITMVLNADDHSNEAIRVFIDTVIDKRNDMNSMMAELLSSKAEGSNEFLFSLGSYANKDSDLGELRAYIRRPLFTNDVSKDKVDFMLLHDGRPSKIGDGNSLNFDELSHRLTNQFPNSHQSPSSTLIKDLGSFSVTSDGTGNLSQGNRKTFDISLKIEVAPDNTEIENGKIIYAHCYATATFNPQDWYEDHWTGLEHPYSDQGIIKSINAHLSQLGYTSGVFWSEQGRQSFAELDFDASYELLAEIWPEILNSKVVEAD